MITFGIGPAGTGKSWLAVAMAVRALQAKQVQRIILTRPAVEAGERLGFLPGDLMAKIDPYLRPLYDALYDMLDLEAVTRLVEKQVIEIAPLAFMRGRTLNNSFIILDEAQNTTPEQMKMFLTRIGFGSRVVVTGDATQVDVPNGKSGLAGLERTLDGIDNLAFVRLHGSDVVRHKIVADIVAAYEQSDAVRRSMTCTVVGGRRLAGERSAELPSSTSSRWARLAEAGGRRTKAASGELTLTFVDRRRDRRAQRSSTWARTGPTDVLSFPMDDDPVARRADTARRHRDLPEPSPPISTPTHAGTFDDELALLVVHGVLHVLGHDHADATETATMRGRELALLERYHWDGPAPAGFRQSHD